MIGNELFQLSLNPKDWITDENAKFRLKLSHLETKTDAYIAKKSINEWHTIIDSDILKSNINLVIEKDGSWAIHTTWLSQYVSRLGSRGGPSVLKRDC